VEEIFKMNRQNSESRSSLSATPHSDKFHSVPLIVAFTKYDLLVTSCIEKASDDIYERDEEGIWSYGEEEAHGAFDESCTKPLIDKVGNVPVIQVSSEGLHSEDDD